VWNLETGGLMNVLSRHSREVRAIAVSPDGLLLASGGHDRVIMVWGRAGLYGKLVGSRPGETTDVEDKAEKKDEVVSAESANHGQSVFPQPWETTQTRGWRPLHNQYRSVVGRVWETAQEKAENLYGSEIIQLKALADRLGLSEQEAADIEREVLWARRKKKLFKGPNEG
jgi:hypothetical protein